VVVHRAAGIARQILVRENALRPLVHFTTERGWMNDPNGLLERDGVHHLYFQHNPDAVTFGRMRWGHATSTDLLTWTEHPSALVPGEGGGYDTDGVWSGCAVPVDGEIAFLYTGIEGDRQLPCLATAEPSAAGLDRPTRYPGNPVIAAPPTDRDVTEFRDHAVRRVGGLWHQVIGGASVQGRGSVFGYTSPDLVHWTYRGVLLEAAAWDLPGDVWECPELFVVDGRAVLVVSLIGPPDQPVLWLAGTLDGDRMVPDAYGLLDVGNRFYAPQSYLAPAASGLSGSGPAEAGPSESGLARRLMFGWLREQLEPDPGDRERVGIMTLPRELTLRDGRPVTAPAAEVTAARSAQPFLDDVTDGTNGTDATDRPRTWHLPSGAGGACLELELTLPDGASLDGVELTLTGPDVVSFAVDLGALVGTSWWSRDAATGAWQPRQEAASGVRVVFDAGVVEAFASNGASAAWTPVHLPRLHQIALSAPVPVRIRGWWLAENHCGAAG